ncbi:MAG: putative DNA-binding domain-containing protein [Bdellovibrionales bacterium]|nr:putative DNA-binding domain-containing protein [Bdellovibrionales bacterium]
MESKRLDHIDSVEDLKNLQRTFFDVIRRPLLSGDKMAPDERVPEFIAGNAVMKPEERIELYAQQYWWRLLDSLIDDFPMVSRAIGESRFRTLIEQYLTHYPSASYTLRHAGNRLADFIRIRPELTEPFTGFCHDAAMLEYTIPEVFCAADSNPITLADLQADPTELNFALKPALTLLELDYAVHEVLEQDRLEKQKGRGDASNVLEREERSQGDSTAERTTNSGFSPEKLQRKCFLAVHRIEFSVYCKEQSEIQFMILKDLQSGIPLEEALQSAAVDLQSSGDSQLDIGKTFQDWVSLGWLTKRLG